jgi:hypothetical protein
MGHAMKSPTAHHTVRIVHRIPTAAPCVLCASRGGACTAVDVVPLTVLNVPSSETTQPRVPCVIQGGIYTAGH